MIDLDRLDLDEIATALQDQTDYEHRWLIDPRTGDITSWTSDTGIDGENPVELDELDLMLIDPLPPWVWYSEEYPDLVSVWHAFSDARAKRRAVEWLLDAGLIKGDDARRFLVDLTDPKVP